MSEEATERVIISVTPEISKTKISIGRNSTGKTKNRASLSFLEGDEKPVPHYLRTSTSSCHDFCKYGIKHDLEVKKRHPIRQRFLASKETPDDENNQANVVTQQERRKKENRKLVVPQEKNQGTNKPVVIRQNDLSPEKIIQLSDSPTNLAKESAHEFSNVKFNSPSMDQTTDSLLGHLPANQTDISIGKSISFKLRTPSSILTSNESDEDKSTNLSEGLSEKPVNIKFDQKATENGDGSSEFAPTEGSSAEPVSVKLTISSSIQHGSGSALDATVNLPAGMSEEPMRVDLMATFPVKEVSASAEHVTSRGSDASTVELIGLPRSSDLPSSREPKSPRNVTSPTNRVENGAEGYIEEDSSMKQKATLSTVFTTGSPVCQSKGLSKKGKQITNSTTGAKAKREASNLKRVPMPTIGVSDRPEVVRQAKIDLCGEPSDKKRTAPKVIRQPSIRKTIFSVKPETRQRIKSNIASVTPGVVKKKALSTGKNVGASAERATTYMKIKNLSFKTTSRFTSSGGPAQRNREKIIKMSSQSDGGEQKVLGQSLSSSLSMKSHPSRVSVTKIRIYRNVNPASHVKNQTKAGKLGLKKETLNSEPKPAKINLKTVKQNLRKHKSPPSDGEDNNSESKLGEVSKSTLRKEVTRRISTVISKGEIDRKHRRTASVHSEDKFSTAHKLKFSRGKIVSLQQENNAPRILRFRRAKTASDNQNARGDVATKGYRSRTGQTGPDSNTPISKAPTVVLRHQDVQEKKDAQGLLNQVIEETASKLVETRKSKVKALVGAFETVISLQESKVAPLPVP